MKLAHVEILCLFIAQVALTFAHAYEGCTVRYGRRGCYHRVLEGVLVTCDGQNREKSIPINVPQDTVYLSLINFRLGTLKSADFTANIQTVECLQIVDSGVTKIEPDAFSTMSVLRELSLENTHISSESLQFINHDTFEPVLLSIKGSPYLDTVSFEATANLQFLKTLSLADNAITSINKDIFEELKSLEMLDLSGNNLESLDWDEFTKLEFLNQLFLDRNMFQTIPVSMYGVMFAVKELTLSGNPFHCNCDLRWLREFYNFVFDKDVDYEELECASPRKRKMMDMSVHDFRCAEPHTPTIRYYQLDDHRFELNCSSYGDPSPTLTLTLPDGRKIITPPSDDLSVLEPLTPQIVTERGAIKCHAKNTVGGRSKTSELPALVSRSGVAPLWVLNYVTLFLLSALLSLIITGL